MSKPVWGVLDAQVRDLEQMLNATNGELDYALGLVAVEDPPDSDEGEPGERVAWLTHETLEPLIDIVRSMVHPDDDCWYDHHGYCQAHGWMETDPPCPHKRAKALIDLEDTE